MERSDLMTNVPIPLVTLRPKSSGYAFARPLPFATLRRTTSGTHASNFSDDDVVVVGFRGACAPRSTPK